MFATYLNVHGNRILVESYDSFSAESVANDFHYFKTAAFDPHLEGVFHLRLIPRKKKPLVWVPILKTKRSILYFSPAKERKVCFFEKAWVHYQFEEKKCTIYCDDKEIAYETVYLVLLSYIGESLDLSQTHRIHGMGFSFQGKGAILLAGSGGGKSTLAMELLKREEFHLLSDDTPLLSKNSRMLAFPQRIATKDHPEVDKKFVRKFKRVQHGEKFVVKSEYFQDKIRNEVAVKWLFLLDKDRNSQAEVDELNRLQLVWPLVKWLVVGYETPQIWELYLRVSRKDIQRKAKILFDRFLIASELLMKARIAKVKASTNPKETEEAMVEFLRERT